MATSTTKRKQTRWKCPVCDDGHLAPQRMRKDDVRRYCLPCSSEVGRLVERTAPSMDRKREAKADKRKAAAKKKRATVAKKREAQRPIVQAKRTAERFGREGFDIKKEADRLWKLLEPYHGGRRRPTIQTTWTRVRVEQHGDEILMFSSRTHAGFAYQASNRITLHPKVSWHVLAHELVHIAVGNRYKNGNRESHDEVFYKCLKDLCERRWKIRLSFYNVPPWGYAVDHFIERQMAGVVTFKTKVTA